MVVDASYVRAGLLLSLVVLPLADLGCAQGSPRTGGGRDLGPGSEPDASDRVDAAGADLGVVSDLGPVIDGAASRDTGNGAQDTGPGAQDTGPLAQDTGPLAQDTGPLAQDTGPIDRCSGVNCAPMANACNNAACNPANGTCVTTPRTGVACDDGNACTTGDACSAAGVCVGGGSSARCGDATCNCGETPASCATDCGGATVPSNACSTGTQSRDGCGSARIIPRSAAAWSSGTQNTCTANDRHDDACPTFDVGNDHTYAIYVRAGERVSADLASVTTRCAALEEFNSFLKFKFNANTTAAGATSCPTFVQCASGPSRSQSFVTTRTYDATADGWLFVIVDGGASAYDEHRGYYNLTVTLSRCVGGNCGC